MTDLVACPGCAGEVDRDEHLLCPTCHTDLTGVVPPPPAARAPAAPEGVPAVPEGARALPGGARALVGGARALPGGARAASPTEPPAPAGAATWTCPSRGCERNAPLPATVAACPYCLEPRAAAPAPGDPPRFELRDEAGAIVVELSGPGPWRLGRGEADSSQLAGCMTVSRTHALLARRASALAIRDLGSSNRTFVGKVALQPGEERIVEPGCTIGLGKTVVLRVRAA